MLNIDFKILNFIHEFFSCRFLDFFMPAVTALGDAGIIWIAVAVFFLCTKKHRRTGAMLAIGLTLGLILGSVVLKPLIARPRPFSYVEGISLLISPPKDFSFPSGHTLASFVSAVTLMLEHKKGAKVFLCLAILISFSRLYLYVHFPSDVICGAIFGTIIAFFVKYLFDRRAFKKSKQN